MSQLERFHKIRELLHERTVVPKADFLREQEDWAGAEKALLKALAAPARPGRERADAGRRAEAQAMLKAVREELASR